MIVWGGYDNHNFIEFNTGGRYDPSTDTWQATSMTNAPTARDYHTAVWTGREMIVWGGELNSIDTSTGGRYCVQSQAPMAQSAFSRKTHGVAGTFDIALPLTGNVGIECRSGGATNDYQMIITFASAVTFTNAAVTAGVGSVSGSSGSGTPIITIDLTGVTNAQRITVTLLGVSNGTSMGDVGVQMGVLIGDTNGSGAVNSGDISQVKGLSGVPINASNFRADVTANGAINSADVNLVKLRSGTVLPP
jgi:hypothetical protein